MVVTTANFKRGVVCYLDNEVIPKAPSNKKILYVGMGILAPKLIDQYIIDYKDMLCIASILTADGMINIDEFESFFSQLLVKVGGYTLMGIKLGAEDVHTLSDICRGM